jgi:acetolactate synthase-1/2/3 large subunit
MCPATHGADRVIETLAAGGVDVCFTNPGTSEMQLVAAFDRMGGVRPILTLFEGVAAGAADGFGRMLDRPASTLLHTGPGLANGLANFHNARKARTPIVSLVGDHAIRHRGHDSPLSANVEAFAQPVSGWVRTTRRAEELAEDVRAALDAATRPPGRIATLIIPANCAWEPAGPPARPTPPRKPLPPSSARVEHIAEILRSDAPSAILLAGRALRAHGLETAGRIAASCGVRPFCPTFAPRVERGAGRVAVEPLPYFAEKALAALAGTRHLVLVGAASPVAFFAYPDKPSALLPEGCETSVLSHPEEDGVAALEALAEALGATRLEPERVERPPTPAPLPAGPLTPEAIHRSLAALLPEAAIVSDEAISGGFGMQGLTRAAAPHDWLQLMGGAIGQGLPLATGAAIACPDRKVVCLEADGSALYTFQSLWTQAREGLDVTTVVFANRRYAILEAELERVGATAGPLARSQYAIDAPTLDFVRLAEAQGVPAAHADDAETFHRRLAEALAEPGPRLIEARVGGS